MRIVIIGAGPTGLGAAWRLHELSLAGKMPTGEKSVDWVLLEGGAGAGGLSSSVLDDRGFTWDLGGHVLFSHYAYFSELLDGLLPPGGYNWREREAWVWMRGRFVPYPLQNNVGQLPADDACLCINGLLDVYGKTWPGPPRHFEEWLERGFGRGLVDVFLRPYNRKVWAYAPAELNVEWMGERVATVDLKKLLANVVHRREERSWGPNARFRFPAKGGTGAIWTALAAQLPQERLKFGKTVVRVDAQNKVVWCADGSFYPYDKLISTMPLDLLCRAILKEAAPRPSESSTHPGGSSESSPNQSGSRSTGGPEVDAKSSPHPGDSKSTGGASIEAKTSESKSRMPCGGGVALDVDLERCALGLRRSSTHVIGLGMEGQAPAHLATKCWMYFPEDDCPFYRVTVFSNYAASNAPAGHWSLLCEVSESPAKPVDAATVVADVVRGCLATKLLTPADADRIVSRFHRKLEYGYPTPFLGRDQLCKPILAALKNSHIYSRGRFGAHDYSVSNQDHSLLQGVECVDNILLPETSEKTLENPSAINGTFQHLPKLLVSPKTVISDI